ncbi:glycoside hydrolase superfamily [Fimicolochytrium jonesii]|uniref:glycoside hydrolase superfamily n=1 Tax=Fimicolochytrium jonesii TaxID=1396493 RepID=UPI0022FF1C7D|nr:glycoside hydrolase superfamily [Fimicolochytrium jonesii]KAI8824315.1 glycoside hydrolase superfamily [Fimicolochytrium jonesii]
MKSTVLATAAAVLLCTAASVNAAAVQTFAPLEQSDKILFGAWVDSIGGTDSPTALNQRFNYKPLSFFQGNFNIPANLTLVDRLIDDIEKTATDAIIYLTVYPMDGLDLVTDEHIKEFGTNINNALARGRRFLIRYAPEMNGNWFAYGQHPAAFVAGWKHFVGTLRNMITDKTRVAFIWAPNSSNGYPFLGGRYNTTESNPAVLQQLDTNKDGKYDEWDDPYSPFYPGDEWVDWVGLSMYHYGKAYPWVDNVLPQPGTWEAMLIGKGTQGHYNFYSMFSGNGTGQNVTAPVSKGGKPFIIAETAATFHEGFLNPSEPESAMKPLFAGPGMVAIKQAWWRQIFNSTAFTLYPKLRGVCFFEFRKQEETTMREFRALGCCRVQRGSGAVGWEDCLGGAGEVWGCC